MKTRTYTIRGIGKGLLMHNERLADPLNKWTRAIAEISKKRTKTEDDHIEMGRREWFGAMYLNEDDQPIIPERCLEAMIRDGAKKEKQGKNVQSAAIVTEPALVRYPGPKTPDGLWADESFRLRASVGVSGKRVTRTRPLFPEWSVTFVVEYDENVLQARDIDRFIETAGRLVGIGDWRPKYGRFEVENAE
jgi:hypothetical protein